MKRIQLLSLAIILSLAAASNAQNVGVEHYKFEVGAFGATSSIGERTHATLQVEDAGNTYRNVGLEYSKAAVLGFRVTENIRKNWGMNLEYSFANQPMTFTNLGAEIPSFKARQSVHRMAYEIMYYPLSPYRRARPYAFIGPGLNLFHIHKQSKDAALDKGMNLSDSWKAAINWGGGLKFIIQDHVIVNAHFTDNLSGVPRYGLPKSGDFSLGQSAPGFDAHGMMHNWQAGVGLSYQFESF